MQKLTENLIKYTPPMEQLLPFTEIKCSQPGCTSIFTNLGNLDMHLQKHHKIVTTTTGEKQNKIFFCPDIACIYNVSKVDGKHFKCLKYLRQHYQKVHIIKTHACGQCNKLFTTAGLLKSHQLNTCGKKFACLQCGWQYDNREALVLHGRRKGHTVNLESKLNLDNKINKVAIPRVKKQLTSKEKLQINQHQETQTEATLPEKRFKVTSAQTDYISSNNNGTTDFCLNTNTTYSENNNVGASVDFPLLQCDIETQTELQDSSTNNLLDQMFAHSSHMHTQTCDDFLTELGLADIQTQTNWSNLDDDRATGGGGSGDGATVRSTDVKRDFSIAPSGAYDELLVSTETQTSFTQCLLDSCSTATHDSSDAGPFGGLYTTQHTQTCDTLLEGLFGSQESDFMGTFQSTYTQT